MKKADLIEIWTCQHGNCFYCHRPMSWAPGNYATSYTKDHFKAKSKGNGLNGNTVLAHEKCNKDKSDRDPNKQERAQFKRLYKKIDERAAQIQNIRNADESRRTQINNFNKW